MSVLEHIRKRPALVISILGLALLLFLFTGIDRIGDLFIDRDTVAKVDGEKIKIQNLNQRAEQTRDALQRQGRQVDDYSGLQEEQLQTMINEVLLDKEIDRLGITVTDEELQNMFFGPEALPYFTNMANGYGFQTTEDFYTYANSNEPGAEQVKAIWDDMVNNTTKQLRAQKFNSLLGALKANKLDAQSYYDDNATTKTIAIARQDYSTLADDDFAVSDDEIRARYKEDKELYSIPTEQRIVDYILINVTPSEADYLAAQQEVENAIAGLKQFPSTEAVSGNFNFKVETLQGRRNAIADNSIKNSFDQIEQDTVRLVSFNNNTYTIAKLISSKVTNDSVYVDMAVIDPAAGNVDSIIGLLNAGTPATDMAANVLSSRENIGFSLIDPQNAPYKDQLLSAEQGSYFALAPESGQAEGQPVMAVKVVRVPEAARVYEIAKITRIVEPSSQTYNDLTEKLRAYITANATAEQFKANGAESSFDVLETSVTPSMLNVLNLPSSAGAARWVMDSKKGEVSDIFSDDANTYLLALAVKDIYDNGYTPVSNARVTNEIAARLRSEKKGAKLVADYNGKGKSVSDYATLMNTSTDTITVNYGQAYARGIFPGDPKFFANVAVAKEGELVGPVDTRNCVVAFTVTGTDNHGREFDFDTDATTVSQREVGAILRRMQDILRANKKVKYSVQRFFTE